VRAALLTAGVVLCACGPTPAQVAGTYSGNQNLIVTGGAGEIGSQVISINQTGSDISFSLGLCNVKASADTTSSFAVHDFKCSKVLTSQSWELTGDKGSVTSNANGVNVSISGKGKNGQVESPFSWSFSGSK
jgi:hypothetical protein